MNILIQSLTNTVLAMGKTIELLEQCSVVTTEEGNLTVGDMGVGKATVVYVENTPDDLAVLPQQPNYMYVDGEFVLLTESE